MPSGAFTLKTATVDQNLRRIALLVPLLAARALNEIAERTMTDAKEHTPVEFGVLKASGRVAAHASASDLRAELAFGTEYAIWVHERTELRHAVGEAKFLENAVNRTAGTFTRDLAAGIAAGM